MPRHTALPFDVKCCKLFVFLTVLVFLTFVLPLSSSDIMEPINSRSKLVTAQDTACLVLADTVYTFEDFYWRKVQPNTPCGPNIKQWTFDCLPTPSSEVMPRLWFYVGWLMRC